MKAAFSTSFRIVAAGLGIALLSGCGLLMGDLRRDLDDRDPFARATYGGRFYERGTLLDDEEDGAVEESDAGLGRVGHTERRPAAGLYRLDEEDDQGSAFGRPAGRTTAAYSENQDNPPESRKAYRPRRATREDFIDRDQNEGSLWASDGQTNYYFTKNKIRGVGDLVNISVEDPFFKDITRELTRTLTPDERYEERALAQERIRRKALGIAEEPGKDKVATTAAAPAPAPAAGEAAPEAGKTEIREATDADIDVAPSMELKNGDIVMAEIVERYPNGNYKIRGTKRIPYRFGYRFLTVTAIARGVDIAEDDTITSGKLYEYRMEVVR